MTEKLKTIDIKGKEYVTVNERIRYFNEHYPNGSINTEFVGEPKEVCIIRATVTPDNDTPQRFFTAYACEKEGSTFINKTSHIENCETSAVGRALGFMGIGVDSSIASAEEVLNAQKQQKPKSVPKDESLIDQITKIATKKFKKKAEFDAWLAENEFAQELSIATEFELARILMAIKK